MKFEKSDIKNLFVKVCINEYPSFESRGWNIVPRLYRREDLTNWAKEAFERNEMNFYCEPVDERNPYGKLRLSDPKYTYKLKRDLSEEEFEILFSK